MEAFSFLIKANLWAFSEILEFVCIKKSLRKSNRSLQGYGHYFHQQRVHNDPLEDVMGSLLEMNPQEASELLESKGLTIMPMDFAYTLLQIN